MRVPRSTVAVLLAGSVGCSPSDGPLEIEAPSFSMSAHGGMVHGGGRYVIPVGGDDLHLYFSVSGRQTDGEAAEGTFHHRTVLFGQLIEFHGTFTCLAIDDEEGRAWIGGVITKNKSEREPYVSGEIFEPGRDIWFRVLDGGPASARGDRTTFVGFEGGAGIITSQEYCDQRPWPDDNARTNPVTRGNVTVFPG